jgi:hypothetical protein
LLEWLESLENRFVPLFSHSTAILQNISNRNDFKWHSKSFLCSQHRKTNTNLFPIITPTSFSQLPIWTTSDKCHYCNISYSGTRPVQWGSNGNHMVVCVKLCAHALQSIHKSKTWENFI